jgi:hypothetical protein
VVSSKRGVAVDVSSVVSAMVEADGGSGGEGSWSVATF